MSRLQTVFVEERDLGFTAIAPLRLVWATLADASSPAGVTAEQVAGVRTIVARLGEVMNEHEQSEGEELRRARALTQPLLDVLATLVSDGPESAWNAYRALKLLAGAGLLSSPGELL